MSMIGEYLRIAPSGLRRALEDPQWALEYVEQTQDFEDSYGRPPKDAMQCSTYKTWHMLGFLFTRLEFPVNVVYGEEPLAEDDWGYGPPRYLPVERVELAARELGRISYDDLIRGVSHTELAAAGIYPLRWDSPESLEWGRGYFKQLASFFRTAAAAGDAVLVWID